MTSRTQVATTVATAILQQLTVPDRCSLLSENSWDDLLFSKG